MKRPSNFTWFEWHVTMAVRDARDWLTFDVLYGKVPAMALVPITKLPFLLGLAEYEYKTQWPTLLKECGPLWVCRAINDEALLYLND